MRKDPDCDYVEVKYHVRSDDFSLTTKNPWSSSIASLLETIFYQENHNRNHQLCNIVSTERYILFVENGFRFFDYHYINVREYRRGHNRRYNPALGTQDEDKKPGLNSSAREVLHVEYSL